MVALHVSQYEGRPALRQRSDARHDCAQTRTNHQRFQRCRVVGGANRSAYITSKTAVTRLAEVWPRIRRITASACLR